MPLPRLPFSYQSILNNIKSIISMYKFYFKNYRDMNDLQNNMKGIARKMTEQTRDLLKQQDAELEKRLGSGTDSDKQLFNAVKERMQSKGNRDKLSKESWNAAVQSLRGGSDLNDMNLFNSKSSPKFEDEDLKKMINEMKKEGFGTGKDSSSDPFSEKPKDKNVTTKKDIFEQKEQMRLSEKQRKIEEARKRLMERRQQQQQQQQSNTIASSKKNQEQV